MSYSVERILKIGRFLRHARVIPKTILFCEMIGNRKQETGNRKQETGNRKQETGSLRV
jgi:hypothetical protein